MADQFTPSGGAKLPAAPESARNAPIAPQETAARPSERRFPIRRLVLAIVALAALGYGAYKGYFYFIEGRFLVSTDDAYVGEKNAILSPKIPGHIAEVLVANNQSVRMGDLLVRLDAGDYSLAVAAAKAKVATQDATIERIARQIDAQAANVEAAQAQVQAAKAQSDSATADRARAALEYDRSEKLAQTNFGSQQRLEQAAADKARTAAASASAEASNAAAQAQLQGARAALDVLKAQKVEAERGRDELVTAQAKAEHDLSFAEIRAPFNGVIGNKAVEIGMFAQPGQRFFALIATDDPYVDANFKETQLERIRVGQEADVAVDALGGRSIRGYVSSISPASGAQFSLLPPENATGNFTKIVQRLAVRIKFRPEDLGDVTLRPGMSVVATVRTRDANAPRPTFLGALGFDEVGDR